MDRKGASTAVIAGILIAVMFLVIIVYNISGGALKFGGFSSSQPSSFLISAALNSTSIYPGYSTPVYLTFFNPFNQQISVDLQASVGSPNYVAILPVTKTISMPASMTSKSSTSFNVSCSSASSGVSSTYLFSAEIPDFSQNMTTSVITYPYGTKASLIPQTIYNNSNQGFMSLSANPVTVETQIPSGSLSTTLNLVISPSYDSGEPYTSISGGSPNDIISQINLEITNSSGIASAFAYYNGQDYSFSVSGTTMSLSLSNVNMHLISSGLPLEIKTTDGNVASQNLVNINVNYNYYFSFGGSPSEISCA